MGEEQVAAHLKLTILQEQRDHLVHNLTPDRHTDFLRSRYILSEEDCDEINAQISRRKRASKFLDILLTKGPDAYDTFCKALQIDGTQIFLLESLNRDFENRIRNYRDFMNPNNRQVIRVIQPPNLWPPPPPRPHFTPGESLGPVEHQCTKVVTPPASPDFLKNTGCNTTSVSSISTAFTDLSSNIHPLAHTSTTGASGINPFVHAAAGTMKSNGGCIHKGVKESIPEQESGSAGRPAETGGVGCRKRFDAVEILRTISSSGSHPASSSPSERMRDFSSFSSSFPSSSSSSSSFPSSPTASSPFIMSGISESVKSPHAPKLLNRGGSEDDAVMLSPIHGQPQSTFVSPMPFASHVPDCALKNKSDSADEARLCDANRLHSPRSENEESGEFFSSLDQSWVDTSTGSDTSCDDRRKGQIFVQKHTSYPRHFPGNASQEMCSFRAPLTVLTVHKEHQSQENAPEQLMSNSADEKEKCTSHENTAGHSESNLPREQNNNSLPKTVLEMLCEGPENADFESKLHTDLSNTKFERQSENGTASSRAKEMSCESESCSASDRAVESQFFKASVDNAQTAGSNMFVVDLDKNPGDRTSSQC